MQRRSDRLLALLAVAVVAGSATAGAAPAPLRFDAEALAREAFGVSALAVDAPRARVAVGDARRVTLLGAGHAALTVVSRRGPVTALVFAPDGVLLSGSPQGLERIDTHGRRSACDLGPGEASASVLSLAAAGGFVAAGTARGTVVSGDGLRFAPVAGLPAGPSEAVALRANRSGVTLFVAADGAIHEAALAIGAGVGTAARRSGAFEGQALRRAVYVGADAATGEVVALSADAVSVQSEEGSAWRTFPLALPPGAAAVRALRAVGRAIIATDRGILEAESWDGPFSRAPAPAGVTPALAVAAGPGALYVGTARGLLIGRGPSSLRVGTTQARGAELERLQAEPSVQAVHAAAIRYLDLDPARSMRLRNGVDHRALLPVLSLHLARESSTARTRDYDESFVSGGTRQLNDHGRDQDRQVDAGIALSWDLGDLAYHPEAIDVSREAREVIELRDDVLDEITQLYFERRRTLVELARLDDAPESEPERLRLLLRAEELAAGLDAWTGGWFSRHAARSVPWPSR